MSLAFATFVVYYQYHIGKRVTKENDWIDNLINTFSKRNFQVSILLGNKDCCRCCRLTAIWSTFWIRSQHQNIRHHYCYYDNASRCVVFNEVVFLSKKFTIPTIIMIILSLYCSPSMGSSCTCIHIRTNVIFDSSCALLLLLLNMKGMCVCLLQDKIWLYYYIDDVYCYILSWWLLLPRIPRKTHKVYIITTRKGTCYSKIFVMLSAFMCLIVKKNINRQNIGLLLEIKL